MNNVIALPRPSDPDKDLIAQLEELVSEAKSGSLQGIAFAAMYLEGDFKTDWGGKSTCLPMMGAISLLHQGFAEALNSLPDDDEVA